MDQHKNVIYLAGDSSLDNKFWLFDDGLMHATNDYQYVFDPPVMKPDVSYYMNQLLNGGEYWVINASVEESTLAMRENSLIEQDEFIKQNITSNDILIVSVGGNHIALKPTTQTMFNMAILMYMNSTDTIEKSPSAWE